MPGGPEFVLRAHEIVGIIDRFEWLHFGQRNLPPRCGADAHIAARRANEIIAEEERIVEQQAQPPVPAHDGEMHGYVRIQVRRQPLLMS